MTPEEMVKDVVEPKVYGRGGQDTMTIGLGTAWVDGGSAKDPVTFNLTHPFIVDAPVEVEMRSDRLISQVELGNPPVTQTKVTIITNIEFDEDGTDPTIQPVKVLFADGNDRLTVAGTPSRIDIIMGGGDDVLIVSGSQHEILVDGQGASPMDLGDHFIVDISADPTARSGVIRQGQNS